MFDYDLDSYLQDLRSQGCSSGAIRRKESADVMNMTFREDSGYRRVYILTPEDGWMYIDARLHQHSAMSILKDAVDHYIMFRPGVKFPIGTYVFIADNDEDDIGFSEYAPDNPFIDANFSIDRLWMIVGYDENQFARHNVLKCNWDFKWIHENKYFHCFGAIRTASSYTAGVWAADYTLQYDQITSAWLPDTYMIYKNKLEDYNIDDTRFLFHQKRFMITSNVLDPKIYAVTKIVDLAPAGLLKLTLKQDEYNLKRDNVDELICDYYDEKGVPYIKPPVLEDEEIAEVIDTDKEYSIIQLFDINGSLEENDGSQSEELELGKVSYFTINGIEEDIDFIWELHLVNTEDYSEADIQKYLKFMPISKIDDCTISIKPSKGKSLLGKSFILTATSSDGVYAIEHRINIKEA